MLSLPVEQREQITPAGCLSACVQMVLGYLGIETGQGELNRLLGLTAAGIPASHLVRLEAQFGVHVGLMHGTAESLKQALVGQTPPIVFVRTAELAHWTVDTQHAVVVVGYDYDSFLVNDPAFAEPYTVPTLEFMLAWDEFDNRYALITR